MKKILHSINKIKVTEWPVFQFKDKINTRIYKIIALPFENLLIFAGGGGNYFVNSGNWILSLIGNLVKKKKKWKNRNFLIICSLSDQSYNFIKKPRLSSFPSCARAQLGSPKGAKSGPNRTLVSTKQIK